MPVQCSLPYVHKRLKMQLPPMPAGQWQRDFSQSAFLNAEQPRKYRIASQTHAWWSPIAGTSSLTTTTLSVANVRNDNWGWKQAVERRPHGLHCNPRWTKHVVAQIWSCHGENETGLVRYTERLKDLAMHSKSKRESGKVLGNEVLRTCSGSRRSLQQQQQP